MEVTTQNDVKIYNLSKGKPLPEWLSSRQKRKLAQNDINVRNRIELLQDFEMPDQSDCIQISKDGQYILATGIHKPRVRCFEVGNLSMKFERCFDSDVVKFHLLSDDYSKMVFLHNDRYVEFHAKYGKYYRTRIPRFGRDFDYHQSSCDMYFVADSNEIYRLNLEQGKFMNSLVTDSSGFNVCKFNPVHELFVCGSVEGRIEAWDPRCRSKVGTLDCAFNSVMEDTEVRGVPSVTSLCFKDGLNLAVGTSTGQVLLYDIRSNKPVLVKDHMYGFPIKSVHFHSTLDIIASMDKKVVKIWNRYTGKPFTSMESDEVLNDMCLVPNSGMIFIANNDVKIKTYYIPAIGPAPRWCSFIDNLTEELEESTTDMIYDDYKFLTVAEIDKFGLSHLIGSNLLRAYMHGYFIDMRLYHKAKMIVDRFSEEEKQKQKIKETMESQRENRVKLQKLPNVNKDLAQKLMERRIKSSGTEKADSLLADDRFKALFKDPKFQIDTETEQYRLNNPSMTKLDKKADKKVMKRKRIEEQFEEIEDEEDERSDVEYTWSKDVNEDFEEEKNETRLAAREADNSKAVNTKPKFLALKEGLDFKGLNNTKKPKNDKITLGERLDSEEVLVVKRIDGSFSNREMTFTLETPGRDNNRNKSQQRHLKKPRTMDQPTKSFFLKSKPTDKY